MPGAALRTPQPARRPAAGLAFFMQNQALVLDSCARAAIVFVAFCFGACDPMPAETPPTPSVLMARGLRCSAAPHLVGPMDVQLQPGVTLVTVGKGAARVACCVCWRGICRCLAAVCNSRASACKASPPCTANMPFGSTRAPLLGTRQLQSSFAAKQPPMAAVECRFVH